MLFILSNVFNNYSKKKLFKSFVEHFFDTSSNLVNFLFSFFIYSPYSFIFSIFAIHWFSQRFSMWDSTILIKPHKTLWTIGILRMGTGVGWSFLWNKHWWVLWNITFNILFTANRFHFLLLIWPLLMLMFILKMTEMRYTDGLSWLIKCRYTRKTPVSIVKILTRSAQCILTPNTSMYFALNPGINVSFISAYFLLPFTYGVEESISSSPLRDGNGSEYGRNVSNVSSVMIVTVRGVATRLAAPLLWYWLS